MHIRPRTLLRAGMAAGLALTAFPFAHGGPLRVPHAGAAPYAIRGLSPALIAQAGAHPVDVIVLLRPGAQGRAGEVMSALRATGATSVGSLDLVNGIAAQVSAGTLNALRFNPNVQEVTIDREHLPLPVPDAADLNAQIAHAQLVPAASVPPGAQIIQQPDTLSIIHADAAQKRYNGRGVRLAIVDSGIDLTHPDLQGIMLKGPDGKPLYKDFTGSGSLMDTVGHGTAVSGVIAAQARTVYQVDNTYRVTVYPEPNQAKRFDNKTYFTVGGVAPGVKIMMAKIFDTRVQGEGAFDSNIVRAIEWAIANHADVISESFGASAVFNTGQGTDVVAMADEMAVRHGITVVVANGNAGPGQSSVQSPAQAPDVIAVGASTDYSLFAQIGRYADYNHATGDNIASFTSRGPTFDGRLRPDVVAPGSFGWSTVPRNPSQESPNTPPYLLEAFGGTSMATPVTAGTAALVINAYMETHGGHHPSPAYVKQVLMSSADDLGYPAIDQAAGRVNALRAINMVTHQGPSVLLSGSLALHGQAGDRPSGKITVTNSGSTPESVSFAPQVLHTVHTLGFSGTAAAEAFVTYKFTVPAGIARLTLAAYWDATKKVPFPGNGSNPAGLRVRLYDPQNDFVNYNVSGDNGTATTRTTAGKPVPGVWTALVYQSARPDNQHPQASHYINVPFTALVTMDAFGPGGGTVTPGRLTLAPGRHATVTFSAGPLRNAGIAIVTLHVRERSLAPTPSAQAPAETTATIPVAVTTAITIAHGFGAFSGVFAGADNQYILDEINYFDFTVPANTRNMLVTIQWPHKGNWFLLTLLDPQGRAHALEDNSLPTTSGTPDLSQRAIDGFFREPAAGHWQVQLIDYQFVGPNHSEPFTGTIRFNENMTRMSTSSVTVAANGSAAPFAIQVHNPGATLQAYFTYATTNTYNYVSLGGTGGTLQDGPLGIASTQAITYNTNFVPPGTQQIISEAHALNSNLPVNIQVYDPVLGAFSRNSGGGLQAVTGATSRGSSVVINGPNLPIGRWSALLTLPSTSRTGPVDISADSYAYALAPNPWVSLDAELQPDLTLSSNPPVTLPGASATIHGSVRVPANTAPGTYHAHIFIYSLLNFDQIADLPLDITVAGSVPPAVPTPDPFLADIASSQYFGEGATATGLTDQMDLVNPGNLPTHAQIRLLTDTGWTTLIRYAMGPHSRMSVNMQSLVGKNQSIAAVVQGDEPIVGGRLIARDGAAGSYSVGTAAPATKWYFADGYTVGNFSEFLTILNPNNRPAHVHLHLVSDQGDASDVSFSVDPSARNGVKVNDLMNGKAVSATITSDLPVVAERTQLFGDQGQGVTTTIGATAGLTDGYIDPGNLPAGAQAHLSVYNPHRATARVTLTLLDGHGRPTRKLALRLAGGHRATIDLSARYGMPSLGALITSDVGIVGEKVAYFGDFRHDLVAGSDLPAVAAPATMLVFPGGSTAHGASEYLALYNPGAVPATATVTVLYAGNHTLQHTVTVPAARRLTLRVADLGAPSGASSLIVTALSGAHLYATQTTLNAGRTDGSEVSGVQMTATAAQ